MPSAQAYEPGKRVEVVGELIYRPAVTFSIQGVKVTALVDTGATCSLLRLDIFQELANKRHRSLYLKPGPPLCGISGQSIDVKGVTQIKIDNTRTVVKVAVVGKMDHEMILGADNLRKGQGIINFRDDELFWHNKVWPLHRIGGLYVDSIGPLLPETGSQAVNKIVQRNSDIFSAKGEHNGCCSIVPMTIKTTGPPISLPAYRTPLVKRKLVEEAVADMLAEGVIRPSSSPYASPVTLVPKKDGTTRFCVDYRKLNSVTVRDQYPLPQIQDIFDQIGGSTIFSTLDLKAGYWQLPMEEESIAKTAFRCHMGHYEFLRMPFGLTNAPSVFQRTMDKVLASLIGKCVMVYIDDIVIYSENMDDHLAHIQLVFDCLRKAGLRLKPTKCSFGLPSVKLLGYIVNKDGIAADPEKIQAIQNLAPPTDIKGVRSFLGMTGFYRQCMSNYAAVAEPLETLKRKHAHFQWGTPQQNAFEQLKGLLTSSSVMAAPKINHPYKLYTDACEYAVGAILVQEDEKGVERVIQYISHPLSTTQRKWATIEKEAFAVVYAINKLRPYLYGAKFTVFTDHKPLTSLFTKDMQNTKIQRWGVLLAEYGAQIKYRAGKNNIRADMLSRIPPQREIATFDCDQWVDPAAIPDQRIEEQLPLLQDGFDMTIIVRDQEQEFAELRKRADNDDEENSYILINNALYSVRKPTPYSADYPRLVLPSAHQNTVIDRAHKEVGHMATEKTLDRLREAYVWPSMRKTIRERLRLCPVCQVHQRRSDHVPMGEMPLAQYPMQIVGADLIGPFVPSLSGNKYVLTIIDHCTGWVEAFPLPNKSNESVWNAWATQFVPRHGVPELLITDNGQEFCAKAWVDYLKKLGVIHHRTSPVHPLSNGRVERFNRTLKEMLAKTVNNYTPNWENKLGDCLAAYRNSVSSVTGYTPFFLLYGRRGRLPLTRLLTVKRDNYFGNRLDDLAIALKVARQATTDSRRYNRERLARRANCDDVKVGDTVVVKAEERVTLTSRWDPMWEVTRVRGPVVWIRQQQTSKTKVLNREKVRIVDPDMAWEDINPRPVRDQRRRAAIPAPIDRSVTTHDPPADQPAVAPPLQTNIQPPISRTPPPTPPPTRPEAAQSDEPEPMVPEEGLRSERSPSLEPMETQEPVAQTSQKGVNQSLSTPHFTSPQGLRTRFIKQAPHWALKSQDDNQPSLIAEPAVSPVRLSRRRNRWVVRRQPAETIADTAGPVKRQAFSPPSPQIIKKGKCEAIALVSYFTMAGA